MLISVAGISNNLLEPHQESMGEALVLSPCSLIRNHGSKPTGVLEHCHEGKTN